MTIEKTEKQSDKRNFAIYFFEQKNNKYYTLPKPIEQKVLNDVCRGLYLQNKNQLRLVNKGFAKFLQPEIQYEFIKKDTSYYAVPNTLINTGYWDHRSQVIKSDVSEIKIIETVEMAKHFKLFKTSKDAEDYMYQISHSSSKYSSTNQEFEAIKLKVRITNDVKLPKLEACFPCYEVSSDHPYIRATAKDIQIQSIQFQKAEIDYYANKICCNIL